MFKGRFALDQFALSIGIRLRSQEAANKFIRYICNNEKGSLDVQKFRQYFWEIDGLILNIKISMMHCISFNLQLER
jgi:hypothetical protein